MNEFWGLSTTAWTAIYTLITFGLFGGAIVAAMYAKRQWKTALQQTADARKAQDGARRAQVEASRPYIVVTLEPSAVDPRIFDLVVKNIGQRPAFEVAIALHPRPVRADETRGPKMAEAKMLNEPVAMIAPAQELRAFYDDHQERDGRDDLPTSHQVSLTYRDSSERSYSESSVLDIDALEGVMFAEVKTIHNIGKTLDEIHKTLKSASLLRQRGSVEVEASIEPRVEKKQRRADERAEQVKHYHDFVTRVRPTVNKDGSETTSADSSIDDDST